MSAAQNRFKQASAPLGLSVAAHSLPAQAGTARRAAASGKGLFSEDTQCEAWGQA